MKNIIESIARLWVFVRHFLRRGRLKRAIDRYEAQLRALDLAGLKNGPTWYRLRLTLRTLKAEYASVGGKALSSKEALS